MPRLFVAIELPPDVKERLVALQTHIPTARWVNPEQMHLTLRFLGDVPENRVESVKSALETVQSPGFDLALRGVGRFPPQNKKAPRVLWVGIPSQPLVMDLQEKIENELRLAGFPPDNKAFHPHITLARLKVQKPVKQVSDFLTAQARFRVSPFSITRFILVKSVLSAQGPTYTNEAIYNLSRG
jgi:2'-5' RNA ligase